MEVTGGKLPEDRSTGRHLWEVKQEKQEEQILERAGRNS